MAGESPDKSDKKQSSGKTARKASDPRLSAFRGEPDESASESAKGSAEESAKGSAKEPANGSAKGSAKGSGAGKQSKPAEESKSEAKPGAESVAKPKPEAGGEPESGADVESGAGSASESASEEPQGAEGDGAGAEGGDDRLRAAVAAWVSTKGDEDAEAGEGDGEGDADAGTSDASEGADGADGDADEDVAGTAAKSEAKQEAKSEAKPDAKPGAKQQVKSEEKAGTAKAVETESASENESGSGDKPESEGKSESRAKVAVVDQPTSVFKTVGPQKGKPGGAADAAKASNGDGKGGDAAEADAEVEAEGSAVDEATRVFAFAKSKKPAEAEGVDHATTAFKISPPAKDGDAAKSKAKDKPEAEDKPESKGKSDGKGAGKAETDAKTDTKADSKTDGKKGAKDAKAPKAAERDSERTSQFVALKSADDGTAGRSLGKTAPKTPARTPDNAADKPGDEGKSSDKAAEADAKPAGKAPGALPAAEPAKSTGTGKSTGTTKPAGTAKAAEPTAAPKPAAPKPADRTGATPSATTGATPAPAALPDSEHTKQQPLPPLDLLAQLTNTPPPPETPLRSVVRRFKIWTPLAVLLVIIFVVAQAVRPLPDPTLTVGDAKSSFTFEGGKLDIPWPAEGQAAVKVVGSGDLGTFGPQKPVPTASVAKIMTAYVVLRDHPLKKGKTGPQIKVDAKAVAEGGSTDESRIEGLSANQKFSEQDMIKMLMIPSGNNIARLLARWDTKSTNEAAFVKKMNAAAKDLGMKNTTYTDPSGLDPKTVSTAVDQLKLAEAVMKFDAFRPIVSVPNADIPGLPERINSNIDDLLLAGLSIKGIKTGSSTAAGGTLSWAAYKGVDGKDQLILGTMMDQHFKGLDPNGGNSLTLVKQNSKKVIEAVRNALTSATAVKKGQVVGYVDDGLNGRTPVVATKDLKAVGVPGQKLTLSVGDGGKTVPHTAKAGTEVGVLTVGNGQSKQKVPVALQQDLVEPSFGAKLVRIT